MKKKKNRTRFRLPPQGVIRLKNAALTNALSILENANTKGGGKVKYKIGDRVIINNKYGSGHLQGTVGTVIKADTQSLFPYGVELDDPHVIAGQEDTIKYIMHLLEEEFDLVLTITQTRKRSKK
jgi:hypothetical protein